MLLGDEARFIGGNVLVLERVGVLSGDIASFGASTSSVALNDARTLVQQPVLALFGHYARSGARAPFVGGQWPVTAATLRFVDVVANDELFGGAGADVLIGQQGDDVLTGDAGSDVLVGDTLDVEFAFKTTNVTASLNVLRLFGGAAPALTLAHAATTPPLIASSAGWPSTATLGNVGVATLMPDVVLHAAGEAHVVAGGAVVDAIDRSHDVPTAALNVAHRVVGLGVDAATTLTAFTSVTAPTAPAAGLRRGLAALTTSPLRALTALIAVDVRSARSAVALAPGNDNLLGGDDVDLVVGDNVVARVTLNSASLSDVSSAIAGVSPLLSTIQVGFDRFFYFSICFCSIIINHEII